MLRRDMVRSHNSSSTTQSVKTSPDASSDIAVRSPRAESSAGDATLIKNTTGDVSIEKTSPRVSPIKGASPMKKAVNGDSPAGNQSSPRMLNERISSPDSMFEEDGHAKGLSHCTEAQSMPIDEGGRQAQTVGGSPMEVNIKGSGSEDPSKISVVRASPCRAKRIPESSDFGYLYSVSTTYSCTSVADFSPSGGRSLRILSASSSRSCFIRDRVPLGKLRRSQIPPCSLLPLWLLESLSLLRLLQFAHHPPTSQHNELIDH